MRFIPRSTPGDPRVAKAVAGHPGGVILQKNFDNEADMADVYARLGNQDTDGAVLALAFAA